MTRKLIAAAAVIAAIVACTKNEQPESGSTTNEGFRKGQQVTLTFSASYNNQDNAPDTKVTSEWNSTTSEVNFKWEEGDQVKVTVVGSSEDPEVFTLSSGAGSSTATFTGKMPDDGTQYTVQYPVDDPDITTQAYSSSEAIPHDMMKFAAECKYYSYKGPQYDVVLKAQNAVLRLNLYGTDQTIGKIVITNTTSSADPKPAYTLTCGDGVALGATAESATPFYIVIPAGNWNFSAKVYDNASPALSICTFSKTSTDKYFTANKVLNMPAQLVECPHYIEGSFDYGPGIQIGDVVWAPVNCGIGGMISGETKNQYPYGKLYQWGRKYGQAYEIGTITPETMTKEQGEDAANKDKFGEYNTTDYNWFSGGVDNTLWNGSSKGTYDPCPTGWRVSTYDELLALYAYNIYGWTYNVGGQNGCYFNGTSSCTSTTAGAKVFLPAAGCREYISGYAYDRGGLGDYWSSSVTGNFAWYLYFGDGYADVNDYSRALGYSVRCVQE